METEIQQNKVNHVQVLRGLAVTLVTIFHFTELLPSGYVGVDIFFVISGFVLSHQFYSLSSRDFSIQETKDSLRYFWMARLLRLFPAYLFVMLLTLIGLALIADNRTISITAKQALATSLGFGNVASYAISGDYFHPEPNTLIHLWSLSAEIQIYLSICIIAVLCALLSLSFRFILIAITITCFIVNIFSLDLFIYAQMGINHPDIFQYYSPISHIWQFTSGILIADFRRQGKGFLKLHRNYFLLLLTVILALSTLQSSQNVLVLCSFLTCVILILNYDFKKSTFLKELRWIGDRSYSIYLIHLPMFYLVKFFLISFQMESKMVEIMTALILTLFLSHYCYELIEQRYRLKSDRIPQSRAFFIVGVLTVLIGILFYFKDSRSTPIETNFSTISIQEEVKCRDDLEKYFRVCGEGKNGKRILVVGDSHASALGEAVSLSLGNRGFKIYISTLQSCPFYLQKFEREDSPCTIRNRFIHSHLLQNNYYAIFSTFRNPNFDLWTPGTEKYEAYREQGLASGITYLNSRTERHYFYFPNSELTSQTWFRARLDPELRIRIGDSFPDLSVNHFARSFYSVLTDYAMCRKETCSFRQLRNLLGPDGNHLNDTALNRLIEFLSSRGI